MWGLNPPIRTMPLCDERQSLNHWTTGEVLQVAVLILAPTPSEVLWS